MVFRFEMHPFNLPSFKAAKDAPEQKSTIGLGASFGLPSTLAGGIAIMLCKFYDSD